MVESAELVFNVSEFVALVNQTMEYAYSGVIVTGELANLRVSQNKWLYFDLKDEESSLKCFGTVYQLPGPLEDGMMLKVRGTPRLHPRYGFSLNTFSIQPAGEGSIKKAANLLEAKLAKEGLFAPERKRILPYPPAQIGLITSGQSAAYADFIKILNSRWGGLEITLADVQVQGEAASSQIASAIASFNQLAEPPEVLVITRGGGSPEDLAAFSDERVVRAVSASRIPTLVAIGHEIDTSLAELAADQRASTPSNAAELLVPDKREVSRQLNLLAIQLADLASRQLKTSRDRQALALAQLGQLVASSLETSASRLSSQRQLLAALDPNLPLARGYALVRNDAGKLIRRASDTSKGAKISVEISNAKLAAKIEGINGK